jgi:hypothetical protein
MFLAWCGVMMMVDVMVDASLRVVSGFARWQVSMSPYQISFDTPLFKVNMIFHMLRLRRAFVQRDGTLYGMFNHKDLIQIECVVLLGVGCWLARTVHV